MRRAGVPFSRAIRSALSWPSKTGLQQRLHRARRVIGRGRSPRIGWLRTGAIERGLLGRLVAFGQDEAKETNWTVPGNHMDDILGVV